MKEGFDYVRDYLREHPVLYAATMGLDRLPQVHPAVFCCELEGALYFAAAKSGRFYGELSQFPHVRLCAYDAEKSTVFRMEGTPVFTEEAEIVSACLGECPSLREKWGQEPSMLIAWFLKDAVCEFGNEKDGTQQTIELGTPANALVGIRIKKKTELRDRLAALLREREEQNALPRTEEEVYAQKLLDGALLYFAETAKAQWPRMDIQPIERSTLFETYDERERFTTLSKKIIGNAVIEKVEDLSYWLSKETLRSLGEEKNGEKKNTP